MKRIVYYLTLTSPEHVGSSCLASGIWIIKKIKRVIKQSIDSDL